MVEVVIDVVDPEDHLTLIPAINYSTYQSKQPTYIVVAF